MALTSSTAGLIMLHDANSTPMGRGRAATAPAWQQQNHHNPHSHNSQKHTSQHQSSHQQQPSQALVPYNSHPHSQGQDSQMRPQQQRGGPSQERACFRCGDPTHWANNPVCPRHPSRVQPSQSTQYHQQQPNNGNPSSASATGHTLGMSDAISIAVLQQMNRMNRGNSSNSDASPSPSATPRLLNGPLSSLLGTLDGIPPNAHTNPTTTNPVDMVLQMLRDQEAEDIAAAERAATLRQQEVEAEQARAAEERAAEERATLIRESANRAAAVAAEALRVTQENHAREVAERHQQQAEQQVKQQQKHAAQVAALSENIEVMRSTLEANLSATRRRSGSVGGIPTPDRSMATRPRASPSQTADIGFSPGLARNLFNSGGMAHHFRNADTNSSPQHHPSSSSPGLHRTNEDLQHEREKRARVNSTYRDLMLKHEQQQNELLRIQLENQRLRQEIQHNSQIQPAAQQTHAQRPRATEPAQPPPPPSDAPNHVPPQDSSARASNTAARSQANRSSLRRQPAARGGTGRGGTRRGVARRGRGTNTGNPPSGNRPATSSRQQATSQPQTESVDFVVDKITAKRQYRGNLQYRVIWKTGEITWNNAHAMSNCADLIRDFEKTQTDAQPNPTSQPKVTRRSTRAGNHRTAVAAMPADPGITPGGPSALPDGHVDAVCSSLEIPPDQLENYRAAPATICDHIAAQQRFNAAHDGKDLSSYLLILYHFLFDGLKERRNDPRCDKTINATSSPREIVAAILTAITFDRGPRA